MNGVLRNRAADRSWRVKNGAKRPKTLAFDAKGLAIIRVMQIDLAALPNDPATLQQMLRELVAAAAQEQVALQGAVQEREAENDKLRLLIQRLLRNRFGRRSEQLTPDQLQFGLEDLEQTIAEGEAAQDAAAQSDQQRQKRRAARPQRNHGALPAHLPRDEVVIDVAHDACPCCGGVLHAIGELRTEQLDIVPSQLRVRVTRRPRYACRACEGAVVVAPAPERPIDGGMATEALIIHVVVSKFCDSLPLYRQSQMLARQGITPGSFDPWQLGRSRLLVADAALRSGGQHGAEFHKGLCR